MLKQRPRRQEKCVDTRTAELGAGGSPSGSVTHGSEHSGHPRRDEAESGCTPWPMQADSPAWEGKWLGKQYRQSPPPLLCACLRHKPRSERLTSPPRTVRRGRGDACRVVIVNLGSEAGVCGAGLSAVQWPGAGSPGSLCLRVHICAVGGGGSLCRGDGVRTESTYGKHLKRARHIVGAHCTFIVSPPCLQMRNRAPPRPRPHSWESLGFQACAITSPHNLPPPLPPQWTLSPGPACGSARMDWSVAASLLLELMEQGRAWARLQGQIFELPQNAQSAGAERELPKVSRNGGEREKDVGGQRRCWNCSR